MSEIVCKSIVSFLEGLEKINKKKGHTYFFRGVSDSTYADQENDVPGIFRKKEKDKDPRWIDDEHNMFHRLIAECPDYFSNCTSTFEYLVMMQHYEFPTRLLDITSNPLVALYFACGGFSSLRGGRITDLDKKGRVLVYEIKNSDIRNHNSDRISILSNLTLAKPAINTNHFLVNQLWDKNSKIGHASNVQCQQLANIFQGKESESAKFIYCLKYVEIYISLFKREKINELLNKINKVNESNVLDVKSISMINKVLDRLKADMSSLEGKDKWIEEKLREYSFGGKENMFVVEDKDITTEDNDGLQKILDTLHRIQYSIESLSPMLLNQSIFNQFTYNIINEKSGFNPSLINPDHLVNVQCVIPKKNNPRIIAQQGLFLLFGLKNNGSKTEVPNIDTDMYAKNDQGEIINITIAHEGNAKINMLEQLKYFGISNKTLFPEINNISYEVKKEFIL